MSLNNEIIDSNQSLLLDRRIIHNSQQFDICIADTLKLKEEVFKIRYRVYCQELGYEPLSKFPDKLERDTYDSRSIHLLLKYKSMDAYIGCIRLVLSSDNFQSQFPFENICNEHFLDFNKISRACCGEVSRLAVLRDFRHWELRNGYYFNEFDHKLIKRRLSIIPLILYLGVTSIISDLDLEYAITFMEPRLSRQLKSYGLNSYSCGEIMDFRGKRRLFLMNTSEAINSITKDTYLCNLFHTIKNNITKKRLTNILEREFYA